MVSLIVRFRFASEDLAEIAEMLKQLAVASRGEEGCVSFIPHHLVDDPGVVLIYEQYRDEKAMTAHRNTEHFKKYVAGGLYQKMRADARKPSRSRLSRPSRPSHSEPGRRLTFAKGKADGRQSAISRICLCELR